jgi:hypothetical protein
MKRDHPHLRSAAAALETDQFAAAVLQALARPVHRKLSWSALRTVILGMISFGLVPILFLAKRFRQYVVLEQQQLWHLAEWLRQQAHHPDAAILQDEADALAESRGQNLLGSLGVVALVALFFYGLRSEHAWSWAAMFNHTYLYPFHRTATITYYRSPASNAFEFFNLWTLALTVAYLGHWLQVQLHAWRIRAWIARFNQIVVAERLTPVKPRSPGIGLPIIWLIAGVILAACGWLWAFPMMLAGAAHRRMVHSASTANRAAMAMRFRDIALKHRPGQLLPIPIYLRNVCANRYCRAPVIDSAAYCPRCGSKVVAASYELNS